MLNFFVLALCSLSVSVLVKLHQNALCEINKIICDYIK